jgi:N-acetylmuramoyl-L-alanine amidase
MTKIRLAIIFVGLFLLGLTPSAWTATAASVKVTAVRISHQADTSRFVFELSGSSRYRWSAQTNPAQLRLVLDDAVLATRLPKAGLLNTPVQSYQQVSPTGKLPTIIQFSLKAPVTVKAYTLPPSSRYGDRLVLDLKPTGAVAAASPVVAKATTKKATTQNQDTVATVATTATATAVADAAPAATLPVPTTKLKRATSLADQDADRILTVVIDPGHGGKDPGATGPARTREKDIVLAISKLLQEDINRQPGFQAKLTRDRDVFIPLRERLNIARRNKADLFIAIHADAAYKQDAAGASVFALSERGATSEMARWLANKENESEALYGKANSNDQVLRSVLIDLSQTHTIAVSLEMGQHILDKLSNITKLHYPRVEQAAFVVLKSPDIPSLLIETGYVTNPKQEQMLRDPDYQQQLVEAITRGVLVYFDQHPQTKRLVTA